MPNIEISFFSLRRISRLIKPVLKDIGSTFEDLILFDEKSLRDENRILVVIKKDLGLIC